MTKRLDDDVVDRIHDAVNDAVAKITPAPLMWRGLTVQDFVALYRRHGIKPLYRTFSEYQGAQYYACPLFAYREAYGAWNDLDDDDSAIFIKAYDWGLLGYLPSQIPPLARFADALRRALEQEFGVPMPVL